MPDAAAGPWSGPRPLVRGTPVVAGLVLAALVLVLLVFTLTRRPGLASRISGHYVAAMAGSLTPRIPSDDPEALARAMQEAGLPFAPRIGSLAPDFQLLGGAVHALEGRPIGSWFYRNARADTVLVEAFAGSVEELGEPDQRRDDREPALQVFHKTSQTLLFWQEGGAVYVLVTTLPTERSVALARRLAAPAGAD